jgi:tetratricopeptide (TPR) repeat protein/tRNA A-37 threonylcarbamoyl transferase component Bud32
MSHIRLELLAAFVDGRIGENELAGVEAELDRCAECRAIVGQLARDAHTVLPTAEPEPRSDDPYIGSLLGGRYRVRRRLGAGAMGSVYEAEHVLIGREVAVKILHAELAAQTDVARRFRNEARAAAAIAHPGIVEVIDMGRSDGGAPFLVMERLRGRGLDDELHDLGVLAPDRAAKIAHDIASAISVAHTKGIVHRDLKPANVWLCEGGRTKVLDFGISKLRDTSMEATRSGAVIGTPQYMAPEQFEDASRVGPAADVYALGALLYRMITGRVPHEALSLPALARAVLETRPAAVLDLAPDAPAGLAAIVERALQRDPNARFASMDELASALRPFASIARTTTLPPRASDARRAVVILFVEGVRDRERLEAAVARHGGEWLEPDAAVFGRETWSGDELDQALSAALDARDCAERLLIAPARMSAGDREPSPTSLELVHAARAIDIGGVLVAASLEPLLSERWSVEKASQDLLHLTARSPVSAAQPLIGREAEQAQLRVWLDTVLDESSGAPLVLRGPPGIGKSRLVLEVIERLAPERGFLVVFARCDPRAASSPFGAVAALVAYLDPALGSPNRETDLADAISRLTRLAPEHGAHLAELFEAPSARSSARVVRDRVRVAVLEVFSSLIARGPLLLVLEDAHWADAASLGLIVDLIAQSKAPLAWLVTAREEARALDDALSRASEPLESRLRGLRRKDVAMLARAQLGGVVPDDLVIAVHERSGGNPFFVQQICAALARSPANGAPLPPTVEGAVQARIDALPESEREICRLASVFDEPFGATELGALGVDGAESSLQDLLRKDLLRRVPSEGSPRYAFRTPLLAEVVEGLLGDATRARAHTRLAAWLETRPNAEPERIGRHWDRAGDSERAARWYTQAALSALRRGDVEAVDRCASRALALSPQTHSQFDLHMARAEALEVLGRQGEQAQALQAAIDCAPDAKRRADARSQIAVAVLRLGDAQEALSLLELAAREAEESGDAEVLARALGKRSAVLVYAGRLDEAAAMLLRAERLILMRAPSLRADAAIWRAQLAAARGDLGDRRNSYWAAVELYEEMGDLRLAAGARVNLADVYNRVGAYEEAERALTEASLACRRLSMRLMEGYARANLAYARIMRGHVDAALEDLAVAEQVAREAGEERLGAWVRLYRARALLAKGRAQESLADAIATTSARDAPARVLALATAARASIALDRFDEALSYAERAMALRDTLGGLEEDDPEVHAVLASALERCGRTDEARLARERGRLVVQSLASRIGDPEWRQRFVEDVASIRSLG